MVALHAAAVQFCRKELLKHTSHILLLAVLCVVPSFAQQDAAAATNTNGSGSPSQSDWHLSFTPYLWASGIHGTTGIRGFDTSIHADFGEILSNLDLGLMAVTELRYKKFLLPVDLMWIKISDDRALPFNRVSVTAKAKAQNFFIGPELGYRVVENQRFTADAFAGFRFWRLGMDLKFQPSILGQTFSTTQTWADPLLGARFQVPLSPKLRFSLFGDVGGFGAGSQLEWQAVPALGYQVSKRVTLQTAYRYLDVTYRNGGFKYDVAMDGLLLGATIRIK